MKGRPRLIHPSLLLRPRIRLTVVLLLRASVRHLQLLPLLLLLFVAPLGQGAHLFSMMILASRSRPTISDVPPLPLSTALWTSRGGMGTAMPVRTLAMPRLETSLGKWVTGMQTMQQLSVMTLRHTRRPCHDLMRTCGRLRAQRSCSPSQRLSSMTGSSVLKTARLWAASGCFALVQTGEQVCQVLMFLPSVHLHIYLQVDAP